MDAARSGVDLAQEEGEVLARLGCAVPAADRLHVRGRRSQAGSTGVGGSSTASRLRPFAIDLRYTRACARMNVRGPVRVCSRARVCVEGQCVRACAPTSLLLHVCGDISSTLALRGE